MRTLHYNAPHSAPLQCNSTPLSFLKCFNSAASYTGVPHCFGRDFRYTLPIKLNPLGPDPISENALGGRVRGSRTHQVQGTDAPLVKLADCPSPSSR